MSGRVIYGPGSDVGSCFPTIDISGCDPVCDPLVACCRVAPCKTRLRDALYMTANEVERSFKLTEIGCNGTQIPLVFNRIGMVLRRRGSCDVIQCLAPVRTTLDGYVVFQWPDAFLRCDPGQYEGDIVLNGTEVGSVLLVKPGSSVSVVPGEAVEAPAGCGTCSCGNGSNCSCGDYAESDECYTPSAACGGCTPC